MTNRRGTFCGQCLVQAALGFGNERGEPSGPFGQGPGGPPGRGRQVADRAEELGELPAGLADLAVQRRASSAWPAG